jgi:hypothetical protein
MTDNQLRDRLAREGAASRMREIIDESQRILSLFPDLGTLFMNAMKTIKAPPALATPSVADDRGPRKRGGEWTPERRAAHSFRMRKLHRQGKFAKQG